MSANSFSNLLLLSQDHATRKKFYTLLEKDYKVFESHDYNSLVERLDESPINLAIVDMDYDYDKNIFDVITYIKKKNSKIPVLLLISEGDVIRVIKAIRMGAEYYVLKTETELYKTLKLRINIALNNGKMDIFNNHTKLKDNVFSLGYDDYVKHVEKLVLDHLETNEEMVSSLKD